MVLKKNNLVYLLKLIQRNECIRDQSLLLKIPSEFIVDLSYAEQVAVIVQQNFHQQFQSTIKYLLFAPTYSLIFIMFNYYGKTCTAQQVLQALTQSIQIQEYSNQINIDIMQYRLLYQPKIEIEANKPFQYNKEIEINDYLNEELGYKLNILISSRYQYVKRDLQTNPLSRFLINILNICLMITQSNFEQLHTLMSTLQKELKSIKRYSEYLDLCHQTMSISKQNQTEQKSNYIKINNFLINDKRLTMINDQDLQQCLIKSLRQFIESFDSRINSNTIASDNLQQNAIRPEDICTAIINQYSFLNINLLTKANFYDHTDHIQQFLSTLLVSIKLLLQNNFTVVAYSQYCVSEVIKSQESFDIFSKEVISMTQKRFKYSFTPMQFLIIYIMNTQTLNKIKVIQMISQLNCVDTENYMYSKQINQQAKELQKIIEQFKQIDINAINNQAQQSSIAIKHLSAIKIENLVIDQKEIIDQLKFQHEKEIQEIERQIFERINVLDQKIGLIEKKFNIVKGKKKKSQKVSVDSTKQLEYLNNILFYEFNKYKIMLLSKEEKSQLKITICLPNESEKLNEPEQREETNEVTETFGLVNDQYFDQFKQEFDKYKIMLTQVSDNPYENMFTDVQPELQEYMAQFDKEFNKYKLMLTSDMPIFKDVLNNVKEQLGFDKEFDKYDLDRWRK